MNDITLQCYIMLDATGKPPSGIFEGVVTMFGNFEECLKVRVADDDDSELDDEGREQFKEFFRGQFCVAEFKPWLPKKPAFYGMSSKIKGLLRESDDTVYNDFADLALFFHFITFRMDFCVPSTCTREDIQRVSTLIAKNLEFKARVLRCETANDYEVWSIYQMLTILVTFTIIVATITSLSVNYLSMDHFLLKSSKFQSLSLMTSWNDIFGPQQATGDKPIPLYGIRAIVLIWIIIVHTVVVVDFQYFLNEKTTKPWTHLSVFAIGFYAGALRRISKCDEYNDYTKSVKSSTGWPISIVVILVLIYGCHDWVIGELPDPFVSALYDATQKIFWSLAVCWILFTITANSEHSKQTLIERFFCHKFFRFMGRLTLVAYLMHPMVQSMLLSSQQQHLYSSTLLML
ncbi:unnamed protein product [Oppiella nova]|uniref:Nose resistant-to-fluoxetine protein N-terminal domain-containing protein n=1 Tax=Oppiella nova TaxID=334625 RepID=A0A7R9Q919_9ACAR|nr:unnamed protein product [Oppiella nova]CAG2159129.1 unnamed protein product [Oppiella nova]